MPEERGIQIAVRIRPSKKLPKLDDPEYEKKLAASRLEQYDAGENYMCVEMECIEDAKREVIRLIDRREGKEQNYEYTFQHAFWTHDQDHPLWSNQERTYTRIGRPLLENVYAGFNACLFAYGQTGSGKTYTMMGVDPRHNDFMNKKIFEEQAGVIPRVFQDLDEEARKPGVKMNIFMSFIQIYLTDVQDLLNPHEKGDAPKVKIQHDEKKGLVMFWNKDAPDEYSKFCRYPVANFQDMMNMFQQGNKKRAVAATKMNAESSRSHSIVVLQVARSQGTKSAEGQLFLIDLAGSERVAKTGATGTTLEEGNAINTSLLELGKMIESIASGKKVATFRNNQLTWMLKNAIGGNCLTSVFGAIGPSSANLDETRNTLEFLQRASKIKCKVAANTKAAAMTSSDAAAYLKTLEEEKARLEEERVALQEQLQALKSGAGSSEKVAALMSQLESMQLEMDRNDKEKKEVLDFTDDDIAARNREQAEKLMAKMREQGAAADSAACFVNISSDEDTNGVLQYPIPHSGQFSLGAGNNNDIVVTGYHIKKTHCTITNNADNSEIYLIPMAGAETRINGEEVKEKTRLKQFDCVCLGLDTLFWLNCRQQTEGQPPSFTMAMRDINKGRGLIQPDDPEVLKQREELEKAQVELQKMQKMMGEMEEAKREAEEKRMKEQLLKVDQMRKEYDEKVLFDKKLMDMITLANSVSVLKADLKISPDFSFEATVLTRNTDRGKEQEPAIVLTIKEPRQHFILHEAVANEVVSTLKQLHADDTKPGEERSVDLPHQPVAVASALTYPLWYLCDYGTQLDDSGESNGIEPTGLYAQQLALSDEDLVGAQAYFTLDIMANLTEAERDLFVTDDKDTIMRVWQGLKKRKEKAVISVHVNRLSGLPMSCARSKGIYCVFRVFQDTGRTPICSEKKTTPAFQHEQRFQVPITDDFITYLHNGSFDLEVFYIPQPLVLRVLGDGETAETAQTSGHAAGSDQPTTATTKRPPTLQRQDTMAGQTSRADLKAQIAELQDKLKQSASEMQKKEKEAALAVVEKETIQRRVGDLEKEREKLTTLIKDAESGRAPSPQMQLLQVQLDTVTKKLEEEDQLLAANQKAMVEMQSEKAALSRQLEEIKKQMETTKSSAQEELLAARREIEQLRKAQSTNTLQAELDKLRKENEELKKAAASGGGQKSSACTLL